MGAIGFLMQGQTAQPAFPMPQTYGEGLLIFGLVVAVGAWYRSNQERIKRESDGLDNCRGELSTTTTTLAELTTAFRELKEAVLDGRRTRN